MLLLIKMVSGSLNHNVDSSLEKKIPMCMYSADNSKWQPCNGKSHEVTKYLKLMHGSTGDCPKTVKQVEWCLRSKYSLALASE